MDLQLPLTKDWFEMTKEGIKTEDYRAITPYFCNKFLLFQGKNKSKKFWQNEFLEGGSEDEIIENLKLFTSFKNFTLNIMTWGYPKKNDLDKILKFYNRGIEIGQGREDWGAKKGVKYFIIKHGDVV